MLFDAFVVELIFKKRNFRDKNENSGKTLNTATNFSRAQKPFGTQISEYWKIFNFPFVMK